MNDVLKQTRRVLIIDDTAAIHADFRTILAEGGPSADLANDEHTLFGNLVAPTVDVTFEVDCALQGEEGYRKVQDAVAAGAPYQLAFVDMRMPPGWDGVQTIQKLWEADPLLHVVICSAYSAYSWKEIAVRLGGSDRLLILKKPFDEYEVFQIANSQTAKWLVTQQARLKLSQLEHLVELRTAELKQTALVDRLTGLPNRELLHDRLNQLMECSRRDPERKFAVLFLDFDRFKVINDSLGHDVGDLLIIGIANRLRHETRRTDTVASMTTTARLGGDEFIVVLDQLRDHHDAVRVTERLVQALAVPYDLKGHIVHTTVSVGITTNINPYRNPDEMVRDADIAMYRAKAAGKDCYMLFDSQMHKEAVHRLTLESDLRNAIENREFFLTYQPILCLTTGATVGFEALVRWKHPQRGMISPADFIPLAEEIGTIVPLGYWVLNEACRQLAEWRSRGPGFANITMSVNLSRKQLVAPELVSSIVRTIKEHGIDPADLKLEITETAVMHNPEEAVRVLHLIRDAGIELHMDDFGTGYSSLSCLHKFPIGGLKIDRAFVSNMVERQDYALVIDAIISLSNKLKLRLVAEGVETAEQLALLQVLGCHLAQGYFFAKPLAPAAAEAFVVAGKKLPAAPIVHTAAA
ncbi:MAG TPA: EAL domain-containing protein [Tepidisphaeraceae bacterium]|jgi:diguanylate cyclase (GGDEF)-like protein|nr:EAL domain-containing protein [Tepidisphaeraceae bacterium]